MNYARVSSPISVQSAAGSQPLATPPADKALSIGTYTVTVASGVYAAPAGAGGGQAPMAMVQPGTKVYVAGPVQNYFASVAVPTPTGRVNGWIAVPALSPDAPTAVGGVSPFTGATPSGAPPQNTPRTPIITDENSAMPPFAVPLIGAALIGAFFLLEQKKKPKRRR